jgi:hypothetical protein
MEAKAAERPPVAAGRSVLDFGVEANTEKDQTAPLQKAINAIASDNQPVFIPPGRYATRGLVLPPSVQLAGAGYTSWLISNSNTPVLVSNGFIRTEVNALRVLAASAPAALALDGGGKGLVLLHDVDLESPAGAGADIKNATGHVANARIAGEDGILLPDCSAFAVQNCSVAASKLGIASLGSAEAQIVNNRVAAAETGIAAEGIAFLSGNVVAGDAERSAFGFRLGGRVRLGQISAVNNMIRNAGIGIAVSNADGGYALISMNMIIGAKYGGIRALNGDEIVGKDLTRGGSESFRNLAIAANVSV